MAEGPATAPAHATASAAAGASAEAPAIASAGASAGGSATAPATLRPAEPRDASDLHRLIVGLAVYERLEHLVQATPETVREQLFGARPAAEAIVAERAGRVVGFALFFANFSTFLARPGLYLEDLFVEPGERGRGTGKALLVHLARLAVERGAGRFEWSVLDWNASAIEFYEAMGATVMPEWRICRVAGDALATLGAPPAALLDGA